MHSILKPTSIQHTEESGLEHCHLMIANTISEREEMNLQDPDFFMKVSILK